MMGEKVVEINSCEVCGSTKLVPVLNLGLHPMCDDLVAFGEARVCKEYPIEILFCEKCITAHQQFQVPKSELFPKTYHYRSRFTADVLNGMKNLVSRTEELCGNLTDKKVLDIGCNDGSLLSFFKEKAAVTIGIEPTDACDDAAEKGHLVYKNFLSPELAKEIADAQGKPDLICFTNVFAHIENLRSVIESLKSLSGQDTVLIIENHYLGSVLDGNQFDTFYHEHPRTYSFNSFMFIAASLGRKIVHVEFPSRYGGNIRVFIGKALPGDSLSAAMQAIQQKEVQFFKQFDLMNLNIQRWIETKKKIIDNHIAEKGKLKAKAFPGRAAILVKLLGLNEHHISAVYEKPGSMKIGHYIPGTRIPILSDDELFAGTDQTETILNFAWHISKEIRSYLENSGYKGEVIDILSSRDFE